MTTLTPFTWTPEATEAASKAFSSGVPASAIAADLGITRNAVIGKMDRLGIRSPRTRADNQPPKPRASVERKGPAKRLPAPEKPVEPVAAVTAPVIAAAPVLRLVSVGKPIWSLSSAECRWPVSPDDAETHLFCAAPTGDPQQSYCPACRKLAYAPSGTKQRVGYQPMRMFN